MWVLRIEPRTSGRLASILNHCASSPAPVVFWNFTWLIELFCVNTYPVGYHCGFKVTLPREQFLNLFGVHILPYMICELKHGGGSCNKPWAYLFSIRISFHPLGSHLHSLFFLIFFCVQLNTSSWKSEAPTGVLSLSRSDSPWYNLCSSYHTVSHSQNYEIKLGYWPIMFRTPGWAVRGQQGSFCHIIALTGFWTLPARQGNKKRRQTDGHTKNLEWVDRPLYWRSYSTLEDHHVCYIQVNREANYGIEMNKEARFMA